MSANSLQIDLPPQERPSVIPWLIALVCCVVLVMLVSKLSTRIPAQLEAQAQNIVSPTDYPNLEVAASGRNLNIAGTTNVSQKFGPLLDQLRQIEGVRDVHDDIVVIDPNERARQKARLFQQALARIDTASVDFEAGSSSFTPDSDTALSQLLTLLKQNPEGRIRIEGHTDNTGADTVNLRVSKERASAVANFLVARGVSTKQLVAVGYGSTQPIADNSTDVGRARNRRIEVSPTK